MSRVRRNKSRLQNSTYLFVRRSSNNNLENNEWDTLDQPPKKVEEYEIFWLRTRRLVLTANRLTLGILNKTKENWSNQWGYQNHHYYGSEH